MPFLRFLAAILLLTGCEAAPTSTAAPGDSGDSGDTGSPGGPTVSLSGTLRAGDEAELPAGAVLVALQAVTPGEWGMEHGAVVAETEAEGLVAGGSAGFTLEVPETPEESSWIEPDTGFPEMTVALFMLGAYADASGDGAPGPGDAFVGADAAFVAWIGGEVSPDMEAMGAVLGWNRVVMDMLSSEPSAATALPDGSSLLEIADNLLPTPRDALGAVIVPDLGGEVSVDLWYANTQDGAPVPAEPALLTETADAAGGNAAFSFPDPLPRPPGDHLGVLGEGGGDTGALGAIYIAVAYDDQDESGAWTPESEMPLAFSRAGAEPAIVLYVEATAFGAVFLPMMGLDIGYSLLDSVESDQPQVRAWEDGLVLDAVQ